MTGPDLIIVFAMLLVAYLCGLAHKGPKPIIDRIEAHHAKQRARIIRPDDVGDEPERRGSFDDAQEAWDDRGRIR